jgi:eukaryotic-like serine/threonine-protein kinase
MRAVDDEAPPFQPVTFGRYQLVERIAIGGMAEIFKAKTFGAHGFEKTIAVKRILPQLAADPEFVDMFINEARLMMRLTHPKVVQVLDFGQANSQYYIAMEYVSGIDALALLRICARHRCRPTTGIAVHIAADVLDALDYAHGLCDEQRRPLGIVHRDISPSNIFVSELGEVKLGDFGIARAPNRQLQTETGALKGKYGYMSPEIVNGASMDHRSDLFSVGVVLAELLMVRRLFIAKTELEVLLQVRDARLDRLNKYGRHIQPELRRILDAALARDPALRYQDAASFRDALQNFLFEQKRMIRPTEVRSFLQRLKELETAVTGETPTLPKGTGTAPAVTPSVPKPAIAPVRATTPPPPPSDGYPDPARLEQAMRRKQPDTGTEYSAHTRERILVKRKDGRPSTGHTPALTTPKPASLEELASSAREAPSIGERRRIPLGPPPKQAPVSGNVAESEVRRLDTEDMLTALSELEEPDSSSRDFKSAGSSSGAAAQPPANWRSVTPTEPINVAALQVSSKSGSLELPAEQSGDLPDHSLTKLLFTLATAEETGLLVLQHEELTKEVYLVDGDPQYITSNLADELFGQYLVKRGVIDEGELAMALAMLPHFEGKLGNALVALKLMRPVQVLRHLTHQVRQKLLHAFGWESGKFAYYHGRTCALEAAPLGLDAFEIVGAGVNELPEEVLMRRLKPLLGKAPKSISPPPVPPEIFRLGPAPRQLFDQLDGRHSLQDLLSRYDDAEQRGHFARIVYLLLETGLAVV